MLIALLIICFACFSVALAKWYIYLENQGAVIYMGLTWIVAGFIDGFIVSTAGIQFGRKYLLPSAFIGVLLGFGSQFILSIVQDIYFRLFGSELFKHK